MNDSPLFSIIIPTYNEQENIGPLIIELETLMKQWHLIGEIVVVDDDSHDNTANIVKNLTKKDALIRIIERKNEKGVISAIYEGIMHSITEIICVMDADFSHPPEKVIELIRPIIAEQSDFVIASRYIPGGGVENWPLKRKIISKTAKFFAKPITKIKDPLTGFFAFKKSIIKDIKLNMIGNKIALEIIARGTYNNILEVPFIFPNRIAGKSKLGLDVMWKYLIHLICLLFAKNSRLHIKSSKAKRK